MRLKIAVTLGLLTMSMTMANSMNLAMSPISEDRDVKVVLDLDEGRFSVHGGCNTMMGSVEINDQDLFLIETNKMASTMMACDEAVQALDNRIASFMESAPKIVRNDDALYLVSTIKDESESHYIPVNLDKGSYKDIEARAYEKIFVYVSPEKELCKLDGTDEQAKCLQIRFDKAEEWQVLNDEIKGFTPEENIEYRLRLKSYETEDDAKDWELDMIVEQGFAE